MKKDLMQYKGYSCRPEYSADDHIFFGKILGIRDMVYFQSDSAKDLEREFHEAVDDYVVVLRPFSPDFVFFTLPFSTRSL